MIADGPAGEGQASPTNQVVRPKFPSSHGDPPPADLPRRVQFAAWVTSPKNRYFAKSYVNRIWSYLLGVGSDRAGRRHPRRQPALQSRAARPAHARTSSPAASTCGS